MAENTLTNRGPANLGPDATVGDLTVTGELKVTGSVTLSPTETFSISKGEYTITIDAVNGFVIKKGTSNIVKVFDDRLYVAQVLNVQGDIQKAGNMIVEGTTTSTIKVWYAVAN